MVDGGAFNYGSHLAIRIGLKVAAITRLALEDFHVVEELRGLGVGVFVKVTPQSTCLCLNTPHPIWISESFISPALPVHSRLKK